MTRLNSLRKITIRRHPERSEGSAVRKMPRKKQIPDSADSVRNDKIGECPFPQGLKPTGRQALVVGAKAPTPQKSRVFPMPAELRFVFVLTLPSGRTSRRLLCLRLPVRGKECAGARHRSSPRDREERRAWPAILFRRRQCAVR